MDSMRKVIYDELQSDFQKKPGLITELRKVISGNRGYTLENPTANLKNRVIASELIEEFERTKKLAVKKTWRRYTYYEKHEIGFRIVKSGQDIMESMIARGPEAMKTEALQACFNFSFTLLMAENFLRKVREAKLATQTTRKQNFVQLWTKLDGGRYQCPLGHLPFRPAKTDLAADKITCPCCGQTTTAL
jgi:hypothetical protein